MSPKSTPHRYGTVAILIHWTTALAIFIMLGTGLAASNTGDPAAEANLLRFHAALGVTVGLLTLFRILWWVKFDRRPADGASGSPLEHRLAKIVHYTLYVLIILMVSSGMATLISTGGNLVLFGAGGVLPDFSLAPPFTAHGIMARLLLVLALGHIGAALFHQVVRRDGLLSRMGIGRSA